MRPGQGLLALLRWYPCSSARRSRNRGMDWPQERSGDAVKARERRRAVMAAKPRDSDDGAKSLSCFLNVTELNLMLPSGQPVKIKDCPWHGPSHNPDVTIIVKRTRRGLLPHVALLLHLLPLLHLLHLQFPTCKIKYLKVGSLQPGRLGIISASPTPEASSDRRNLINETQSQP